MVKIMENQFPLAMVFSNKDRLIPSDHFQSFAKLLGIEQIHHDESDATHRSNSNQSSQASFEQSELEINNNQAEVPPLTDETSKPTFDLQDDGDSSNEVDDEARLDHESNEDDSDCEPLPADQALRIRTISLTGRLRLGGPKHAVCIAKAGHYSLISHSHVIAQQIDKLISSYDLRTANQSLGALPLKH
jgi:hypothetical protein